MQTRNVTWPFRSSSGDRRWSAAALGALSGGRSMLPLALQSKSLCRPQISRLLTLAAAAEMVADKIPALPSRVRPLPLAGRLLLGALAASTLARREAEIGKLALIGAGSALAGSFIGYAWRRLAAHRGHPFLGAIIEDLVCLTTGRRLVR